VPLVGRRRLTDGSMETGSPGIISRNVRQ
jgi:hypothetical protein